MNQSILHTLCKTYWIPEAIDQTCSIKKVFLEISPQACNFIKKETQAQAFFC